MLAAGEAGEQDMPQAHKGLAASPVLPSTHCGTQGPLTFSAQGRESKAPLLQRLSGAQALGVWEAGILLCPSWGLGPRNKALVTPGVLSHSSDHLQDVHWPLLDL